MCQAIATAGEHVFDWAARAPGLVPADRHQHHRRDGHRQPVSTAPTSPDWVRRLTSIETADGPALLFNIFLSPVAAPEVVFPSDAERPARAGPGAVRDLQRAAAVDGGERPRLDGFDIADGARGFVFNAGPVDACSGSWRSAPGSPDRAVRAGDDPGQVDLLRAGEARQRRAGVGGRRGRVPANPAPAAARASWSRTARPRPTARPAGWSSWSRAFVGPTPAPAADPRSAVPAGFGGCRTAGAHEAPGRFATVIEELKLPPGGLVRDVPRLPTARPGRPDARWEAVALGDTVLFHVRGGAAGQRSSRRSRWTTSGSTPTACRTRPARWPDMIDRALFAEGDLADGDLLYLATDALAALDAARAQPSETGLWAALAGLDHHAAFAALVADQRATGRDAQRRRHPDAGAARRRAAGAPGGVSADAAYPGPPRTT